ncbi:PREDICTED: uncharacterized protein LOC108360597 [Rhagoletis zephyria]|uniref:uncharacterized protein LOC108360597 n=1 Tax=Rhagoletis zephyria TaxID=28612 RepID=UPI00081184E2|nr:PREDICTED: uncharacterized protein LOC108360597 [Rhagoletis zephyria]
MDLNNNPNGSLKEQKRIFVIDRKKLRTTTTFNNSVPYPGTHKIDIRSKMLSVVPPTSQPGIMPSNTVAKSSIGTDSFNLLTARTQGTGSFTSAHLTEAFSTANHSAVAKYVKLPSISTSIKDNLRQVAVDQASCPVETETAYPKTDNMTASRTASHPTSYREALTQIIGLCNTILERQSKEAKVDDLQKKITENMPDRCEGVAQQKTLRECKVLIKKVHQSFCRINGGAVTELQLEISDVLPLKTIDALFDVEEKLQSNEYKEEMV